MYIKAEQTENMEYGIMKYLKERFDETRKMIKRIMKPKNAAQIRLLMGTDKYCKKQSVL